ncbi:hypothetical protein QJS10_CPA16g00963 [Acorus calamus]|uniref:F-box protein n=1 Tax=Acorus calamus TaxID=4465 RepID=A0AAV9D0C5_ACOCL|nr:hypothetical protein QJS10_CPA16g00963 [Acorus calamus]
MPEKLVSFAGHQPMIDLVDLHGFGFDADGTYLLWVIFEETVVPKMFRLARVRSCGWSPKMRRLHGDLLEMRFVRCFSSFDVRFVVVAAWVEDEMGWMVGVEGGVVVFVNIKSLKNEMVERVKNRERRKRSSIFDGILDKSR